MISYQVLARKWRPKTFTQLTGQEHITRALSHALDQNRLHHAYLFTGTRGVGKTTLARILAKCLNCETGITSQPCHQCHSCLAIDTGRSIDLIEVDAASRTKVEDIRELLENVQYKPTTARFKIYLIDEVHMLSNHSFNALLKTLEEPPPHVKFLLATTEAEKLPITVLSRCLQFHLKNITPELIAQTLAIILKAEEICFESAALDEIAAAADGSMRDALSLLDHAISYGGGAIKTADIHTLLGTIQKSHIETILYALAEHQPARLLEAAKYLAEQAADFQQVLQTLLSQLHKIAMMQATQSSADPALEPFTRLFSKEDVHLFYQIALLGRKELPLAPTLKIGFEMTLLRMSDFRLVDKNKILQPKPQTPDTTHNDSASTLKPMDIPEASVMKKDDNSHLSWSEIINQLNLSGMTQALAAHCELKKMTAASITLALSQRHTALLNPKQKERLQIALNTYFQKTMHVEIVQVIDHEINSPAKQKADQDMQQKQKAELALGADPTVAYLLETFNATIDNSSIKAVNEENL